MHCSYECPLNFPVKVLLFGIKMPSPAYDPLNLSCVLCVTGISLSTPSFLPVK